MLIRQILDRSLELIGRITPKDTNLQGNILRYGTE